MPEGLLVTVLIGALSGIGQLVVGEVRIRDVAYDIAVLADGSGEGTLRADLMPLLQSKGGRANLHLDGGRVVTLALHQIVLNENRALVTTLGPIPGWNAGTDL